MSSTNGHGFKRAILYARVSTEEQARSGYSLAQQLEALRAYCAREGLEVVEEVTDPGQSGASLERPGMDQVRDLVAAGGVSVVLAQDRDRFAREPAYHYLLRREFEEHGCKLKALNDRGDDSPEGELTDGMLDQLAKYQRAKTAEQSRRGKLQKAREGKIVANHTADYGFKFNATRDGYEVDEKQMWIVRRIFHLVGVDARSLHAVKKILEEEGISPPKGGRYWSKQFVRSRILDDVYKPHAFEEIKDLVSPEVAARLNPKKRYGVWWFNVRRTTSRQVAQVGSDGRHYRRRSTTTIKPKEKWVAVPVPDAGIPCEWVDAAREAIKDNRAPSSAGHRFWELSGGVFRCGGCGRAMVSTTVNAARGHHYYRCPTRQNDGKNACPVGKNFRADKTEPVVWEFVSGLMKDPEQLRADLERMIALERKASSGDPEREAKAWLDKIAEVDRQRSRAQDLAIEGLLDDDELRGKLAALEETRETARGKLEALHGRISKIEELKRDAEALMEHYASLVPEAFDALTPEERHHVYKMLRLKIVGGPEGSLEVSGAFGESFSISNPETLRTLYSFTTSSSIPGISTLSGIRWRP